MERELWDVICFSGEDTLCSAQFAEHIRNYSSCLVPYVVHVEGRYVRDNLRASVLGKLKESNINGYIRNIRVEDIYERDEKKREEGLSVGCSNATLEDIAADKVSFFFFGKFGDRQQHIHETHFAYYNVGSRYTQKDMEELDNPKHPKPPKPPQYLKAIAVAKQLGSEASRASEAAEELLISYLNRPSRDFGANMKEMTADAYRSLENLCERYEDKSIEATEALIKYIVENISKPEYRKSVIYAIEALGFVANHQENSKAKVCEFLSDLLRSHNRGEFKDNPSMYWHTVWASLVTLTRTMHNNLHTAPILAINQSLLDKSVLAEIKPEEARSVIQKVMAEVIISRGEITFKEYLSIFGLNEDDHNDMLNAGQADRVAETKKLGENLERWKQQRGAPKLTQKASEFARNLTVGMASGILVGLMKAYFGLP